VPDLTVKSIRNLQNNEIGRDSIDIDSLQG
jgi:hypothetical protein